MQRFFCCCCFFFYPCLTWLRDNENEWEIITSLYWRLLVEAHICHMGQMDFDLAFTNHSFHGPCWFHGVLKFWYHQKHLNESRFHNAWPVFNFNSRQMKDVCGCLGGWLRAISCSHDNNLYVTKIHKNCSNCYYYLTGCTKVGRCARQRTHFQVLHNLCRIAYFLRWLITPYTQWKHLTSFTFWLFPLILYRCFFRNSSPLKDSKKKYSMCFKSGSQKFYNKFENKLVFEHPWKLQKLSVNHFSG